jgi:hypothetical protein
MIVEIIKKLFIVRFAVAAPPQVVVVLEPLVLQVLKEQLDPRELHLPQPQQPLIITTVLQD